MTVSAVLIKETCSCVKPRVKTRRSRARDGVGLSDVILRRSWQERRA